MSSFRTIDRQPFEELLEMAGGYVLDFTNTTFASFIAEASGRDIYDDQYLKYGDSKAKRLRAFWDIEPDHIVAKVLSDLLELWEYKNPEPDNKGRATSKRCRVIVNRLSGKPVSSEETKKQFLDRDFSGASIKSVAIEPTLIPILEARFEEALRCSKANSPLSAIFMCGSILEGLLLGTALANPREFNQASSSPKEPDTGKVKPFQKWSLAQLIDVSCELGRLKLDVKKFSHALRDFRNFIHPYQQMSLQFTPDNHTAEICLQVLRAAIASLAGKRN